MRSRILGLFSVLLLVPYSNAAEPKRAPGIETIPADGFFVMSVNVAQLWDAEALTGVRKGLQDGKHPLLKDLKKEMGFDLAEIERFTISLPTLSFERGAEPAPILYVTARKAIDLPKVMKHIQAVQVDEARKTKPIPEEISGKAVYVRDHGLVIAIDERTLIFVGLGRKVEDAVQFIKELKADKPAKEGSLADALALAPKHTIVVGADFSPARKALEAVGEIPPEFKPFAKMAQAERGLLTMDLGKTISAKATITFFDAETATKIEPSAKEIFDVGRAILAKEMKAKKDSETKAVIDPILAFLDAALTKAESKRDGKAVTLTAEKEFDAAVKKSLDAFPAWAAVQAERMTTMNNLKQLGLAMHNYESTYGHFPQDIVDKDGKAILSWRVELLPYMEYDNLYKKIDRTKPWDDPANKEFLEQMPDVLKVAGREAKEKGFTYFQMFTAAKAIEGGSPLLIPGTKRTIVNITDGSSNTLMIVDGEAAVNWLKPGDLTYDPKKLPKIGKDGWFFAGFCDGSVQRLRVPKDEVLKALITIDGGEVVTIDD